MGLLGYKGNRREVGLDICLRKKMGFFIVERANVTIFILAILTLTLISEFTKELTWSWPHVD